MSVVAWAVWLAAVGQAEKAGQVFERAYFMEQAKGDLEGAIELYDRLVEDFPDERPLAARSLFRVGLCHERLGYDRAEQSYLRLIRDYPDQEELARLARERLDALRSAHEGPRVELPTGSVLREIVLADGESVGDSSASLSPDGTSLVYVNSELKRLVVYDLTQRKSKLTVAVESAENWVYRWSRDGRRIAYDEIREDENVVGVVEIPGGQVRHVFISTGTYASAVDFSPDSRLLLLDTWERLILVGLDGQVLLDVPRSGQDFRLSPSGEFLAFASEGKNADIYVARLPTRENLTAVTPATAVSVAAHPARDEMPVWSPDGRYLAFKSNRAKSWDLWTVEIEDGRPAGQPVMLERDIGEQAQIQDWLSDGRLSFTKARGVNDIWIQPVDPGTGEATGPASLLDTSMSGFKGQPRWSPDGHRISFRSQWDRSEGHLFIASLVREPEIRIEPPGGFQNADWTPDGLKLVYCAFRDDGVVLGEHDLTTGESRVPEPELKVNNAFSPDVSPDGESVLFNQWSPETGITRLAIFDRRSGAIRNIPNTEGALRGRWSPDGHWLATSIQESLCVLRPDGSEKRCIVEIAEPEFMNPWVSWSPDGRLIAYPRGRLFGNRVSWDLWVESIDGAFHRKVGEADEPNPWWVDWSPDGRYLVLASSASATAFWVLENFFNPTPGEQ